MYAEDFGGRIELPDEAAVTEALRRRYGENVNEFWLFRGAKYPHLAILIAGEFASLLYFPSEGHPGMRSVGKAPLQGQQFMIFYTNTPQEEIEISADAVVPVAAAEEAAIEFFRFPEAPRRIKWLET